MVLEWKKILRNLTLIVVSNFLKPFSVDTMALLVNNSQVTAHLNERVNLEDNVVTQI